MKQLKVYFNTAEEKGLALEIETTFANVTSIEDPPEGVDFPNVDMDRDGDTIIISADTPKDLYLFGVAHAATIQVFTDCGLYEED